jgi:uncharacterized protein YbaR (Trm112 family)
MPAKPASAHELSASELNVSAGFDSSVVARLACPACHGDLRLDDLHLDDLHLICTACSRKYPIVDGIPALIVERAETAGDANHPA